MLLYKYMLIYSTIYTVYTRKLNIIQSVGETRPTHKQPPAVLSPRIDAFYASHIPAFSSAVLMTRSHRGYIVASTAHLTMTTYCNSC